MIFETDSEIQELRERYAHMEGLVEERLRQIQMPGQALIHISHRIKTMESIKEKMERKQDQYQSIHDMRDILGFRVICYFSGDVDLIAEQITNLFRIDSKRSKDKRKLIDAKTFGYLSLHYICALPEEDGEFSDLWFEIQIKTLLQHCWAQIEHDLGYKTDVEVPRDIRRSFSRAACLLETTDCLFEDIRNELAEYEDKVKTDIGNNSLNDVFFDRITLIEFTRKNAEYQKLLQEMAAVCDARISEGHPENLLVQIEFLEIHTLEDMLHLIRDQHNLAMELARQTLEGSELDELSSTAAYYYLFRAKLISGHYSRERIREFFMLTSKNERIIEANTEKIFREKLSVSELA